jgi:maltose O-acetyltransferase
MFIGYYKFRIKSIFVQAFIKFRLRFSGHKIGKGSVFHSVVLKGKCDIRDNVVLGPQVELAGNNIIGSGAKISNIKVGLNSHIESGVICTGYGNGKILIGKECYIGLHNILDWSDDITIGDFVQIAGPTSALWTHSGAKMCLNSINLNNKSKDYRPTAPIIIESNVYIGGNCTIYPGITIGHHSVIAPNSAVTKNVDSHTMVGGVPAKFIKRINKQD